MIWDTSLIIRSPCPSKPVRYDVVKDNKHEWMIAVDGLRPPGQICYGYLATFRYLVTNENKPDEDTLPGNKTQLSPPYFHIWHVWKVPFQKMGYVSSLEGGFWEPTGY